MGLKLITLHIGGSNLLDFHKKEGLYGFLEGLLDKDLLELEEKDRKNLSG